MELGEVIDLIRGDRHAEQLGIAGDQNRHRIDGDAAKHRQSGIGREMEDAGFAFESLFSILKQGNDGEGDHQTDADRI